MYDVVVGGGGISGTMAAIAAAREGCETLLVERYTALGGMATLGLVQPITNWGRNGQYVVGGTGVKILKKMHRAHSHAATPMNAYGPVCDAEFLKRALEQAAQHHKVDLLYHSCIQGAGCAGGDRIEHLSLFSKNGAFRVKGNIYVDATGDADVAASSGVRCQTGSQGLTLMMVLAGINKDAMPEREQIERIWDECKITHRPLTYFMHPRGDIAYINMTEVEKDNALSPYDLTEATIECRNQGWRIYEIFRDRVPGFEDSYIAQTAPALGVRESRRIAGQYILSGEDVVEGRHFDDVVARACSPIDIHKRDGKGEYRRIKKDYAIPYRSLLTDELSNLVVAGRCISADKTAFGSVRRMAPGFAVGEAAGIAASLAVKEDNDIRDISVKKLQQVLRRCGAILDPSAS